MRIIHDSNAIQTFLNLHPENFTISSKELDKYIIGSKIDLLKIAVRIPTE